MNTFLELVAQYGLPMVFVGTFLEGETIVIVAGFLAHQGIIDPYLVGLCAFLGSFFGDQFWFFLGRRHANYPLIVRMLQSPLIGKVMSAIEDHPRKFILTFRFFYGIRTVSPVAVGLSKIEARKFFFLNAIAAVIWAISFTAAGYFFGQVFETYYGDIKAFEDKILLAALVALAVFVLYQVGGRLWRWLR